MSIQIKGLKSYIIDLYHDLVKSSPCILNSRLTLYNNFNISLTHRIVDLIKCIDNPQNLKIRQLNQQTNKIIRTLDLLQSTYKALRRKAIQSKPISTDSDPLLTKFENDVIFTRTELQHLIIDTIKKKILAKTRKVKK